MPDIIPDIAPKKSRAPRRSSVLFASLLNGAIFYLPGRKPGFFKTGIFRAENCDGKRFFVNPFRSVLVRPAKPSEVSEVAKAWTGLLEGKVFPAGMGDEIRGISAEEFRAAGVEVVDHERRILVSPPQNSGGHADIAGCVEADQKRRDAVIIQALSPNNDNNITGPTC